MEERGYEIAGYKNGIKIIPRYKDRLSVDIHLNEYGFWTINDNRFEIPLYCFKYLMQFAVHEIYESWSSPKFPVFVPRNVMIGMKDWTTRSICSAFHKAWLDNINELNPIISSLHKKFFATSCGKGSWRNVTRLLKENNPYAINDAINYKAARIAILYSYESEPWKDDWMLSFAYNNEKYRSLTRTLMNLPNGIIVSDLISFKHIVLPEPVLTKYKFFAYSAVATDISPYRTNDKDTEKTKWFLEVIKRSTDDDIKNAIKYMWHYFPDTNTGDFRKLVSIKQTLKMIFDYLGEYGNWNILGLAKRSEVYHHDMEVMRLAQEERLRKEREELKQSKTALPPISLPKNENIKFLDSYESVQKEGSKMQHCIAQYAEKAVRGGCYLFHVDYKDQMASVEISPKGFVVQSYGQKDTTNDASQYGRNVLGKWAKQLCSADKNDYDIMMPERMAF